MEAAMPQRAAGPAPPPPDWLRGAVRDVLTQSPGYAGMRPDERCRLANAMVKVSALAADLIAEEKQAAGETRQRQPLARAQDAPGFAAADRVASTTRNVLNAVSFPRFVTDLINGVFKAMLDSNSQQMKQYVDLLNNVAASAEGFAKSQYSLDGVRHWLAEHFPADFEIEEGDNEPGTPAEDREPAKLRLREGARMPEEETIRATLGLAPDEQLEAGNPEQLVPYARRAIARSRQASLSTMVMMGMQRIVVESGRINASMRFHVDTRSAANADSGSTFSEQNRVKGDVGAKFGPWGASAEVENNIGYVSTQRSQTTEEMNTDLDLNSSVELVFKSDYLPLNRMATGDTASRIRDNALNPAAEAAVATTARTTRETAQRASEDARSKSTNSSLTLPSQPPGTGLSPNAAAAKQGGAAPATTTPATATPGQGAATAPANPAANPPANPPANAPASTASKPPPARTTG